MIFTHQEAALIRAGRLSSTLLLPSTNIRPNSLRQLRRHHPLPTSANVRQKREAAQQTAPSTAKAVLAYIDALIDLPPDKSEAVTEVIDGERRPVWLTILSVETIDPFNAEQPNPDLPQVLTDAQARAAGHFNALAARRWWNTRHPHTPLAKLVTFGVGDLRDKDTYLSYTGQAGGDYTGNRHRSSDPDAPVIPATVVDLYTKEARALDLARRSDPDMAFRDELTAVLERYERSAGRPSGRDVARTIRMIRHQIRVLDHKLKAA